MAEDGYSILDVESEILTGAILERQRDEKTAEGKYRIRGTTLVNRPIEEITKFGPTGTLVIITVYQP